MTYYSLGSATVANDLVFGWCINTGSGFFPITDLSCADLDNLRLAMPIFPAYIPSEFKAAIRDAHKKAAEALANESPKEAVVEAKVKTSSSVAPADPSTPFAAPKSRNEDLLKLYAQVTEHMQPVGSHIVCSLGYVTINRYSDGQCDAKGTHTKFHEKGTLEHVLNRILQAFW